MAYIYRHIRLDKDEIFYIGVGSDKYYKRSRTKFYRNNHWHNIINKTEYIIEIMLDNLSLEEAHEKEKEFIKLYGRKDLGLGTLVNLTDGGEGMLNITQQTKDNLSKSKKGKLNPFFGKKHSNKVLEKLYKPVIDLETGIFYISGKEASLSSKYSYRHLNYMLNGVRPNLTNFRYC